MDAARTDERSRYGETNGSCTITGAFPNTLPTTPPEVDLRDPDNIAFYPKRNNGKEVHIIERALPQTASNRWCIFALVTVLSSLGASVSYFNASSGSRTSDNVEERNSFNTPQEPESKPSPSDFKANKDKEGNITKETRVETENTPKKYVLPKELEQVITDLENALKQGDQEALLKILNGIDLEALGTFQNCDKVLAKGAEDPCYFEPTVKIWSEDWKTLEGNSQHPLNVIKTLLVENRSNLK